MGILLAAIRGGIGRVAVVMTVDGLGGQRRGLSSGLLIPTTKTRRVFFSFHFQRDIWRVQIVQRHWITKPDRQAAGYFDGSLAEKAKTDGSAAVKRLINSGLIGSSVACVLIGTETYQRHWVAYEIFRSIASGMGVFGVRIYNLKNRDQMVSGIGPNPFANLGFVARADNKLVPYAHHLGVGWSPYPDAEPVNVGAAKYLSGLSSFNLSALFRVYDWNRDHGYDNFSTWVDTAARQAGR